MALIWSRSAAARSDRSSRSVSLRAVVWAASSGADQLLQRQLLLGPAGGRLGLRGGQLIEQARLAISAGIEAEMPEPNPRS